MVKIFMMSAKLATPGLLKIKLFKNKGCDVVIVDFDVINKTLSRNSNYIVDEVMWPKFHNCSISVREVTIRVIIWEVVLVQVQ